MYIAMNRFRVAKGSEAAFEQVWTSRDSHLDKVPGFIEFHLLKGPEAETTRSTRPTPSGQTTALLKPGPNQTRSAPPIAARATTSRSISVIRSSRVLKCVRPSAAARAERTVQGSS